jgi:murein DD-endopeptidase MepM/ murein hydrolase activator NlpD
MGTLKVLKLDYPVADPIRIVQPFGVNRTGVPDFYSRFGLPAHEGVDFGADDGDPIFAAADGTILALTKDNGVHAYGNHVRLTHFTETDEFTSIYAHLRSWVSTLRVGMKVQQGELIGYADSTGNSFGHHLHFALKRKGATARGEKQRLGDGRMVVYPNDLVDPMPYFE